VLLLWLLDVPWVRACHWPRHALLVPPLAADNHRQCQVNLAAVPHPPHFQVEGLQRRRSGGG